MIRDATTADAPAIAAIYDHYVAHTIITFEEIPIGAGEMAARIERVLAAGLPWLVVEDAGEVLGYAYATGWKERSGYRFSVESTIYLRPDAIGRGLARPLYEALIARLRALGKHTVIGGIALPNEASVRLHERLGFERVATFREVGWKHGRWIDVAYWQLALVAITEPEAAPRA